MGTNASFEPTPDMTEGSSDLSDRDLRWMALAMEGMEPEEAQEKLGLSKETVAKEALELKAKLAENGLGGSMDERVEVSTPEEDLAELAAVAAEAQVADERRSWLLLRVTLSELLELANDAESRADALDDLLEKLGLTEKAAEAKNELAKLHRVAETLRGTVETLFDDLREELPPPESD